MDDLEGDAIKAVNEYLISLLRGKEFCKARRVGEALGILVELGPQTTFTQTPNCKPDRERR